jgi:hypothetical protein
LKRPLPPVAEARQGAKTQKKDKSLLNVENKTYFCFLIFFASASLRLCVTKGFEPFAQNHYCPVKF